jgi:hypothetical protein
LVVVEPVGVLPNDPAGAGKLPEVGMVLLGGGKLFADNAPVLVGVGVRTRPDDGCVLLPIFGVVLFVFWHPDRAMKTTLAKHNNCFMEQLFSLIFAARTARARHACSLANGSRA